MVARDHIFKFTRDYHWSRVCVLVVRCASSRGNYWKIGHVAIVVLDRETSNQVRMGLGRFISTPRSEQKDILNIYVDRYIVNFLVTAKQCFYHHTWDFHACKTHPNCISKAFPSSGGTVATLNNIWRCFNIQCPDQISINLRNLDSHCTFTKGVSRY